MADTDRGFYASGYEYQVVAEGMLLTIRILDAEGLVTALWAIGALWQAQRDRN